MTLQRQEASFDRFSAATNAVSVADRSFVVAQNQIELLTIMNSAAVLIDHGGDVCLVNDAAAALLGSGIVIRHSKLMATDGCSNKRLQALVYAAIKMDQPVSKLSPVVVLRQDRRPLLVTALLSVKRTKSPRRDYAILLLMDSGARPTPNSIVLQEAFGLTDAEVRLAQLLAIGEGLENAAAKLGVTKGTASQRLKSIFAKTETHRQGELVSLLMSLM